MFEDDDLVKNLLPAVEEQLASEQTPYVKQTLDRLVKLEEDLDEAKMMIALCLADESNRTYIERRNFDVKRYQDLLNSLPQLPEA